MKKLASFKLHCPPDTEIEREGRGSELSYKK